ncbi:hypothetical protein [Streptomyces sp. KL116D]|uniref:hypothetical protein n=1 Tax=Streptomyces sp. KL116D TaxID=3045152 RepID=UPI003557DD0E
MSVDEAADVDALFELGCDRLRTALAATDLKEVSRQIVEARSLFAAAEAAEEPAMTLPPTSPYAMDSWASPHTTPPE